MTCIVWLADVDLDLPLNSAEAEAFPRHFLLGTMLHHSSL